MLDIKRLRTEPELVAQALLRKGVTLDLDNFQQLEAKRKSVQVSSEGLQAEKKKASKLIGQFVAQGLTVDQAKEKVAEQLKDLDQQLAASAEALQQVQNEIEALMLTLPNLPHASVPDGKSEEQNLEVARVGQPRAFDFPVLDHVSLGERRQQLDFESAGRLTGSRFALMRHEIAQMHRALGQFMLDLHIEQHGYELVNVPVIVNDQTLYGTGQLPKFAEDLFRLSVEQPYYLIPTAEVPLTNLLRDSIVEPEQLPFKFTAHSLCFRSEAGSYGRDTRGMIRQHQFEKVELVQLVAADQSYQALEEMTAHAENVLKALELPYRKMLLCAGDMGFAAAKTYDLEVWLPSQNTYREISSCSNCEDFQTRRLQARVRVDGKPQALHSLNGSGLAVGRTLVAVLENYQQADGSVLVPKALQPYMRGVERILAP